MASYPLATSTWDDSEIDAMQRVIASMNFTMGANVAEYEKKFASFFGSKYAVMSNSGSSANLLAVAAQRYRKNNDHPNKNEIIVPAVSWGTTYYPVHQLGYKLKFVDVDLDSLNSTPEAIKQAISDKTAGVFVVNLLGNPSELSQIRQICDDADIFMLEDNCESMGASTDNKYAGTIGDIGTFSSFFSHHISTMEGGMCLTDDLELAEIMISMRAHGWLRGLPEKNSVFNKSGVEFDDSYKFVLPGYNLRPLELSGAIGIEQLKKLPSIIENRRKNAVIFQSETRNIPHVKTQKEIGESSWFGFSIILQGPLAGKRHKLVQSLRSAGIENRPIVAGNFTNNPVMKHLDHAPLQPLPNAKHIDQNGLFIGNHHYPLDQEISILGECLRGFSSSNS